jgi:hypothetical protein
VREKREGAAFIGEVRVTSGVWAVAAANGGAQRWRRPMEGGLLTLGRWKGVTLAGYTSAEGGAGAGKRRVRAGVGFCACARRFGHVGLGLA